MRPPGNAPGDVRGGAQGSSLRIRVHPRDCRGVAMRCKDCVVGLFGACAADYCAAERAGLMEQAQAAAGQRGHTLGEFAKARGRPTWEARCLRCGRVAAICLDPECAGQDLSGPALVEDCQPATTETPSGRGF